MSFAKRERKENPPSPPHSPLLCAHRPHKTTQGQGKEEEEASKKERDETKQGFVRRGGESKSRLLPPSSVAVQASERPPFVICHFPPPLLPLLSLPFLFVT